MVNEVLGHAQCPLCKSKYSQEVRLSDKSKKPYMNCEECGSQIFARQPLSVKLLRNLAEQGVVAAVQDPSEDPAAKNDGAGSAAASSATKSGEAGQQAAPQPAAPVVRRPTTLLG